MVNRLAPVWLLCVSVCLVDCNRGTTTTEPEPPKTDTVDVHEDTVDGGTDTVDGRKELARLAAAMTCLPMPTGTRYFHAPAPKLSAAASACRDGQDLYILPTNPRGILGIDSISYIDSLGVARCAPQGITVRETHGRYLMDPACGEAWERIRIDITPDPLLTRHRSQGTGRLRLLTGVTADIEAFEVDMVLDHLTGSPIFRNAHLRLAVAGGLSLRLDLVRPHPFRAADFYPIKENPPRGMQVMAGPVVLGADTVGRAILYEDRTLGFLDAAGSPVTPE